MDGCLIRITIFIAIAVAALYAICLALAATFTIGSIYGIYKAAVCYATALKRTYGSDEDYEAGAGLKALVILLLVAAVSAIFLIFVGV